MKKSIGILCAIALFGGICHQATTLAAPEATAPTTAPAAKVNVVTVGGVKISLVAPEGFSDMADASATVRQALDASTAPNNRLLGAYIPTASTTLPADEQAKHMEQYMMVQVPRMAEDHDMTAAEFADVKSEVVKSVDAEFGKIKDEINDRLKTITADDKGNSQLEIGDTIMLGSFLTQDNATGFSLISKVRYRQEDGSMGEIPMVCSAVLTNINSRLIFLYTYTSYKDKTSIDWCQTTATQWLQAVAKAN